MSPLFRNLISLAQMTESFLVAGPSYLLTNFNSWIWKQQQQQQQQKQKQKQDQELFLGAWWCTENMKLRFL